MGIATLPYKVGIAASFGGSIVSTPLVFHKGTAEWFNEAFVTTDVPEPADMETFLEIGSWTWNWMEPVLGQISFVLLCLRFARSQIKNLGATPYSDWLQRRRGERLAARYGRYNKRIVMDFAIGDKFE